MHPGRRKSFDRIATAIRAVLDSSVFIRAVIENSDTALGWVDSVEKKDTEGFAPELVWLEVASALRRHVASGVIDASTAFEALGRILALPLSVHRLDTLAEPALARALDLGLSVYDAAYLALAEVADALLVTADRQLAQAAVRAELIA
jgi:predicted nucleic acid-binding protein